MRKLILWCHRWLGTAFCLLFSLWFLSAFGMMYWDYPEIGPAERLEHAQPVDTARVRVLPSDLRLDPPPAQLRLMMFDGRPAYRFRAGRRTKFVFADDGTPVTEFPTQRIAEAWTGRAPARFIGLRNEPDQWTLGGARALLPADQFVFSNGDVVYVSRLTGEVAQYTTSSSRLGAWLGPIPHWLYFTPLRANGRLWTTVVDWLSGIGVVASLLGLIGGFWIYAPSQRVPYSGQKRWHMIFGLIFGLVACTWVFSGLLSMEPFDSLTQEPETGPRGVLREPPDLGSFRSLPALPAGTKEVEFTAFGGKPFYLAVRGAGKSMVISPDGSISPEFDRTSLLDAVVSASDPYRVAEVRTIDRYEAYYIARNGELPLPALFVRLDDPQRSTFYIDPKTARVVQNYTAASRWNRWLYHGLHSWNLPWLYRYRPAWDLFVLALLAGGSVLSITGAVIGWRFLRKKLA